MSETTAQKIFDEIDKIVLNTKENGIPVFENLDLNKEIIVDFDKLNDSGELDDSNESFINLDDLDDLDDNFKPKFNKFELENLDLSDSDFNNDIVNSCIEIASDLENLLQNEHSCKELINLLNDGKSKEELENLSEEEFQIYERRNWIFLQLLCEYAIHERKNLNELLNFSYIEENYVMQAIIRQNKFGSLDRNKYTGTKAVSTVWFLTKIELSIKKNDYTSVFNTKRGIPNDVCGDLLFEYLEEKNQTDNFIKNFSLKLNEIENEIELSETDDKENNIVFLHEVNGFIRFRESENRFSYKIFRNKNFSFKETVALQTISDKCYFWNRRRILKNAMQNNLSDIYDFANKLQSNRRDEFFVWVRNNRGNFNPEFAQNAGFFSREQEKLLQSVPSVPSERKDEFRKLFRNENFRKVCQTPQAVKNLLTIMETCSLSPIEYINFCLRNGVKIEDIRIALDTFDINKIYEIFEDKLNPFSKDMQKAYEFLFLNNWISFVKDLNKIDNAIVIENKNKLLQYPQISCNLNVDNICEIIIRELSFNPEVIINNIDKLISKECIEFYCREFANNKGLAFEEITDIAKKYLKINNVVAIYAFFQLLPTAEFSEKSLCNNLLKPKFIADTFLFAMQNNNLYLSNEISLFLDKPGSEKTKIEVMKVIVEKKQHFITETFENDKSKINMFYKLAKTCDVFKFINSKEDVLMLNEFLNLGLDVNRIDILDWSSIKSELSKISAESSKKILMKKIVELIKKCDIKGSIYTAFKIINSLLENRFTNDLDSCLNSFVKWRAKGILKILSDILLSMEQSVENLANIVTLLQKTDNMNAMELGAHLAANPEVGMKLTENNVPPQENFNSNEIGKK